MQHLQKTRGWGLEKGVIRDRDAFLTRFAQSLPLALSLVCVEIPASLTGRAFQPAERLELP